MPKKVTEKTLTPAGASCGVTWCIGLTDGDGRQYCAVHQRMPDVRFASPPAVKREPELLYDAAMRPFRPFAHV